MFHCNRLPRTLRASVTTVLCAVLVTTGAMAANVTLQTIDVTPAAKSILFGQKQSFTATGTFSDATKQALGPAISNLSAAGFAATCALLTSGGIECWGYDAADGHTSFIPRAVNGIRSATAVALGEVHGCALLARSSVGGLITMAN
jgi:hypothetical protein